MRRALMVLALALLLAGTSASVAQAMNTRSLVTGSPTGKHCDSTIYYFQNDIFWQTDHVRFIARGGAASPTQNTVTATIRKGTITAAYFPNHTIYRDSPYYWYPDYCLTRKTQTILFVLYLPAGGSWQAANTGFF
jgi:hypothetical protein